MKKSIFILFLALPESIGAQDTWFNKDESENYVARSECSFIQSGDRFILFGGRQQAQRVDIYNYEDNSWAQGAMAPLEFNHFQALQYDGLVWVIGAFKTNNFPTELPADFVYIYNPALDLWLEGPSIPSTRKRGGAGLMVYEDKFYLVGGSTNGHSGGYVPWFDEYDPQYNIWRELPDAPRPRDHFSTVVLDDKLYAISGRLSGGAEGVFAPLISEVDVYDLVDNSWSTLAEKELPTPRAGASVIAFEEEIFVIGGEGTTAGSAFKKVESFNPATGMWSDKADMNHPRHGTQAFVSGSGIYIAGGAPNQGGGSQHNMEVYKEDAPVGVAITASTIVAPAEVVFEPYEEKEVVLQSLHGNAGNFITEVSISGNNFELRTDLTKHLIKSNTSQSIRVAALSLTTDVGYLHVRYDDDKEVDILLKNAEILSTDNMDSHATSIRVIPNPSSHLDATILNIYSNRANEGSIALYTLAGKEMKTFRVYLEPGENTIDLSTALYKGYRGIVLIKMNIQENTYFQRFIVH